MKNVFLPILLLGSRMLYAQAVEKKVVAEHFTNTHCSVCASRNPGFYSNLWQFPEVLHIAYHPSAPYAACPLSQHNAAESDARTNFYGVYGSTPRIVIQGQAIPANANYTDGTLFQSQAGATTPFSLAVEMKEISAGTLEIRTIVKKVDVSALADLQLYAAIVEDTLFFTAQNGEDKHYDVFRKSVWGVPLNVPAPAAVGDSVVQVAQVSVNPGWERKKLYTVALLQQMDKSLVQAARSAHLPVTTDIEDLLPVTMAVYPNPFSNAIHFQSVPADAMYYVRDLHGKTVAEGLAGKGEAVLSALPPGAYLISFVSKSGVRSFKLFKDK